jgi:hypothetical protein
MTEQDENLALSGVIGAVVVIRSALRDAAGGMDF